MRKYILTAIIAIAVSLPSLFGQEKRAIKREIKSLHSETPKYMELKSGAQPKQKHFKDWFYANQKVAPFNEVVEKSSFVDQFGTLHKKYEQYYKGIPLKGCVVSSHGTKNRIKSISGEFLPKFELDVDVSISSKQAVEFALSHVDARKYYWQNEEHAVRPVGELVFINVAKDGSHDFKLAYMIDVYAVEPLSRAWVYVDANTGNILLEDNRIHHADTKGTAHTKFRGTREITTDYTGSTYRLRETGRGNGVETYDLNNGTSYSSAVDFTDADNVWDVTTEFDDAAYDAHWGAEQTYDYFFEKHGRNSYDGSGATIKSYVHYSSNYLNAFWNGSVMTYGDGNSSAWPLTSIDIVAHEITHAVTERTAGLVYSYESGALNESFSDIFGVLVDFYSDSTMANFKMGDEIFKDGVSMIRNMADPNSQGDPHTYKGNYWNAGSSDHGGVHTNSGVQNYWFYLLSKGGTGTNDNGDSYSVNGIGFDKAGAISYRNLSVYLSSNSQYADARTYSIQSALDLYGACSDEVIAVTNAWYAVGVGAHIIMLLQQILWHKPILVLFQLVFNFRI